MKRFMVAAAVVVGLVGMVSMVSIAKAAVITNWCTSTYELVGFSAVASGLDSATIITGGPIISVTKLVKNVRTGIESDYQVSAVSGDTMEFTIIWSNTGEGTADTATLFDYIPAGMTYVAGSLSDTEANATGAAAEAAGLIQYIGNSAAGTNPGPAADGIIKFQATVN